MIPSVAPCTSRPSSAAGSQRCSKLQRPSRTKRSASTMRRAAASSSPNARSAVVSTRTPGVCPTGMPRERAAVEIDVIDADGAARDGAQARTRGEQRRVDPVRQQAQAAPRRRERRRRARAAAARPCPPRWPARSAARAARGRHPGAGVWRRPSAGRSSRSISTASAKPAPAAHEPVGKSPRSVTISPESLDPPPPSEISCAPGYDVPRGAGPAIPTHRRPCGPRGPFRRREDSRRSRERRGPWREHRRSTTSRGRRRRSSSRAS